MTEMVHTFISDNTVAAARKRAIIYHIILEDADSARNQHNVSKHVVVYSLVEVLINKLEIGKENHTIYHCMHTCC